MSNIDKQAVQAVADLKAGYTLGHADVEIIQQMTLDAVTLLDELDVAQKTSAARLGAIDTTHKMFQRERNRADAAEKRISELSQKADIYDMLRQNYGLQGSLVEFVDWQAKRIAELSESHSKLHEGMVAIYNAICADGASTSLSAIPTFVKRAFEESKTAAGIIVKGE